VVRAVPLGGDACQGDRDSREDRHRQAPATRRYRCGNFRGTIAHRLTEQRCISSPQPARGTAAGCAWRPAANAEGLREGWARSLSLRPNLELDQAGRQSSPLRHTDTNGRTHTVVCVRTSDQKPTSTRALPSRLGYTRAWFYDSRRSYPDTSGCSCCRCGRAHHEASGRTVGYPSLRHPMLTGARDRTLVSLAGRERSWSARLGLLNRPG